jgi:uncharacterized protein
VSDWDNGNGTTCQRYGGSLAGIEGLFASDPGLAPDVRRSADEDRLVAVGRNDAGRPLFVAFTIGVKEGRRLLRPVSARYMHAKEIARYATQSA